MHRLPLTLVKVAFVNDDIYLHKCKSTSVSSFILKAVVQTNQSMKAKVLPEPHRAALISISIALSQTPVEAASPRIQDYCVV